MPERTDWHREARPLRREESAMGIGRTLIILGVMLAAVGVIIVLGGRIGLGRLPGDIVVRGERSTFYFPIVTCIVLSILLSLGMWLVQALRGSGGS